MLPWNENVFRNCGSTIVCAGKRLVSSHLEHVESFRADSLIRSFCSLWRKGVCFPPRLNVHLLHKLPRCRPFFKQGRFDLTSTDAFVNFFIWVFKPRARSIRWKWGIHEQNVAQYISSAVCDEIGRSGDPGSSFEIGFSSRVLFCWL